jgi:hypothetical protein
MQTVYCTTPPQVRLNGVQLQTLLTMPEQQFQEWLSMLESMRYKAAMWKDRIEKTYGGQP